MREILFRGKSIDNGKWIYGGYFHLHKTTYCYAGYDDGDNDIHRIVFESMTDWNLPNRHMMADVDPKTVGQYTGLTDKNGVKIFEGDIVKSPHCTYVIMWDSVKALFYLRDPVSRVSSDFYNYFGSDLTVIGNIHDNPELLEGGGDNV